MTRLRWCSRPVLALALAAALAFAVGACGASEGDSVEQPPPIRLVRIVSDQQVVTPAIALLPTSREARQIELAYDIALGRCITSRGSNFGMTEGDRPSWVTDFVLPFASPQPLGPVDPRRMAVYGFHDPVADPNAGAHVAYRGTPTAAGLLASCDAKVKSEAGGAPADHLRPLIREAGRLAGTDRRSEAPRAAWVRCMDGLGFKYRGDGDPLTEFAMGGMRNSSGTDLTQWTSNVSARELDVANATARCQRESRNIDTRVALLVAYEKRALNEHPGIVAEYKESKSRLLRWANEVVAKYPVPRNRVEWDGSKGEGPPAWS